MTVIDFTTTPDEDWHIDGVLPCDPGDYLNSFEEYRGFYCRDVHTRTCPWDKDFFIYSDLDDSLTFFTGIGWADSIGPGLCHWIDEDEMRHYEEPDPYHMLPIWARSVNWFKDRIDNTDTCACAIFLENLEWHPDSLRAPLGLTGIVGSHNYAIPRKISCGYIYTRRLRFHTPPHHDTLHIDLPSDSLCQLHITGHEIGHMVDLRHSQSDSSIMNNHISDPYNPPHLYLERDLDYFLVKPP